MPPSPNDQTQESIDAPGSESAEPALNATTLPTGGVAGEKVNAGVGPRIVTVWLVLARLPWVSTSVSVTVYVPGVV